MNGKTSYVHGLEDITVKMIYTAFMIYKFNKFPPKYQQLNRSQQPSRSWPSWRRRILSPPSTDIPRLKLYIKQLSRKTIWRLAEQLFHHLRHKGKATLKRVGGAETWFNHNPHPGLAPTNRRDITGMKVLPKERFKPHISHPMSWEPAPRRQDFIMSGFENQQSLVLKTLKISGAYSGEPKGYRKSRLWP